MMAQLPPLTVSSSDGPYSAPRPDSLIEHAHRTTAADTSRATRIAQLLIDDITRDSSGYAAPRRDFQMQHDQQLPPIDPGDMNGMSSSEMSLREHLLAAQAGLTSHRPDSHTSHPGSPHDHLRQLDSLSPQAHHSGTIDPAISGSGYGMAHIDHGMMDDEYGPDGKRISNTGKGRELSTSKRAAQNRAAQRAFRQRKEGYIKKLEEENRHMKNLLEESYATLQGENYQLRDYILTLQTRLGDFLATADIPQLQGIQLRDARTGEPLHHQHQLHTAGAPSSHSAPSAQMQTTSHLPPPMHMLQGDLEGRFRVDKPGQVLHQGSHNQHHQPATQSQQPHHTSLPPPPLSAGAVRQLQAAAAAATATSPSTTSGNAGSSSQTHTHTSSYPDYPQQTSTPLFQSQSSDGQSRGDLNGTPDRMSDLKLLSGDDERAPASDS